MGVDIVSRAAINGRHHDRRIDMADENPLSAELVGALDAGKNPLSPRERTVLRRIDQGDTAPLIAQELNLAEGTVRHHLTAAIQKLSAKNSIDAIRTAKRMGWL
ncbi:LuxR C-terminal-related transcriptional regulator [Streptomyces sp. ET3-23]|uniref:response regulator transcription factor n=1 Tax=Streptomyces sp. ET3-23 TaxID=2885643 RepID=UPI001D125CE9|nr:LuxR C-terminal-related transcriptional regulator [Streptomyces sp. ET3-23]MCC2278505.1 LuxR C-terminal-related transcriptional regulator [Streptomyces sp. ET3-23]